MDPRGAGPVCLASFRLIWWYKKSHLSWGSHNTATAKMGLKVPQILFISRVISLQLAMPLRAKSIHFVNYSWIINTFLYMFQRYMGPSIRKRTFFHGYDHESLRKHFNPACLPVRYGGTCTAYHNNFGFWLNKIKQYRDESFDKEMKEFGYVIKEWSECFKLRNEGFWEKYRR